ncbi:MAG: hypothetical protein GF317_02595 [Candidatus Lokiarchaeota archaeon]|nr:hypothetical protein [Candidatus Lokiarchaeota archaeon]MBD3198795.1 hypothetical protein [Candidatus Lokiarchaeota archaeon]
MSDSLSLLIYIKNMLSDLTFINGVIATELMKITENLAALRKGEEVLQKSNCLKEHHELNEKIIEIIKKYKIKPEDYETLENHILKHED